MPISSPKALVKSLLILFAALFAATAVISLFGLDMAIAKALYSPGYGFVFRKTPPWKFISDWGMYPMDVLAGLGGIAALAALFWRPARKYWREGLFFVLLMAVAHGLLVNSVFKTHWGRPRPYTVVELGGDKPFREAWQPTGNREEKSFPSSHTTAAVYMASPWFALRRKDPRAAKAWLAGGLTLGMLMGISRMVLGQHFLTDVLWAGGVVWAVGLILDWALLAPRREDEATSP